MNNVKRLQEAVEWVTVLANNPQPDSISPKDLQEISIILCTLSNRILSLEKQLANRIVP